MKIYRSIEIRSGFSLVEVAMALSIASVALLAVIGIIPQILKYEKESIELTAIGTIIEDIRVRLEGQEFKEGVPSLSPIFYNEDGQYWDPDTAENKPDDSPLINRKYYRGDIRLIQSADSIDVSSPPLAVKIDLYWPLDGDGNPLGENKPKSSVTFHVTTFTGPDWEEIDPNFNPKIEF